MDGLELLATARRLRNVDVAVIDDFLRPIVKRELVSMSALSDFRSAWNEPKIYEDLGNLLVELEQSEHRLANWSSNAAK